MSTGEHQADELPARMAARLRAARSEIVRRWLERIIARVTVEPEHVFPTEELLNHVPILVDGIADYLEHGETPAEGSVPLDAKAMELGALRYAQGFDAYEILKEHELLAGILFSFMRELLPEFEDATADEVALCWQSVAEVTDHIRQATMTHFLRISAEQVRLREERLRRFNRMVSHELKNRVGAIRGASGLLLEPWLEPAQVAQFHRIVAQNAEGLQRVIENLVALSRIDSDARQQRNVLLPQAAAEVIRQLRDSAKLNGVAVRLDPDIPAVEVDAAAVELCLANYVSNAIKYADPKQPTCTVVITGELIVPIESSPAGPAYRGVPVRPGSRARRGRDQLAGRDAAQGADERRPPDRRPEEEARKQRILLAHRPAGRAGGAYRQGRGQGQVRRLGAWLRLLQHQDRRHRVGRRGQDRRLAARYRLRRAQPLSAPGVLPVGG